MLNYWVANNPTLGVKPPIWGGQQTRDWGKKQTTNPRLVKADDCKPGDWGKAGRLYLVAPTDQPEIGVDIILEPEIVGHYIVRN
jgi:hypothetical protein